jgi:orotidine-5'-phosphate decarboxylase
MGPRVIVALDFAERTAAEQFVRRVTPERCRLKVGFELFVAAGPEFVAALTDRGFDVFLDLKFHDIPNTVAQACRRAVALGVWMLNVHALGGSTMLRAAREAVEGAPRRPLLTAVTVLTSHSQRELEEIGITTGVESEVLQLAGLAQAAGLDGVVCSAREAQRMKQRFGPSFLLVTPGIRPSGAAAQDQQRTLTPAEAMAAGSDYLVIGRPITQAADPLAVLAAIERELAQ